MNRQYGIVVGEPHTYLKPELLHLMNQLHEAAEENRSLRNSTKKSEADERVTMETKHRKQYLDLRTKQDKETDEKLKISKSPYQTAKNKQNSQS